MDVETAENGQLIFRQRPVDGAKCVGCGHPFGLHYATNDGARFGCGYTKEQQAEDPRNDRVRTCNCTEFAVYVAYRPSTTTTAPHPGHHPNGSGYCCKLAAQGVQCRCIRPRLRRDPGQNADAFHNGACCEAAGMDDRVCQGVADLVDRVGVVADQDKHIPHGIGISHKPPR